MTKSLAVYVNPLATTLNSNTCKKKYVIPQTSIEPSQPLSVEDPLAKKTVIEELSIHSLTDIDTQDSAIYTSIAINPNLTLTSSQIMEGITEDHQINETLQPPSSNQTHKSENHYPSLNEIHKRLLSDTSSLATLSSPLR